MARVFHDGFETGTPGGSGTTVAGAWLDSLWQFYMSHVATTARINISTARAKSGTYSLIVRHNTSVSYTNGIRRDLGVNILDIYGRAEVNVSSAVAMAGTNRLLYMLDEAGANVGSVAFSSSGGLVHIHAYIGTSLVATHSEAFSLDTWARIEWRLLVDEISGIFEVKRNGDTVINYSGDTKGASSGNGVRFLGIGRNYSSTLNLEVYFDDIAINDTTGTVNNSWVGPGSILLLKPKGAGNYTQWTPDSGNNFARVNEIPHTSNSAYVESDAADEIDTYEMQTLADIGVDTGDPAFNIKAVQHVMAGRWDEAETKLSRVLRLSTTDNTGTAVTLVNTYNRYWDEIFNVNPFDSLAWGLAGLNALEAGVKHIAST